MEQLKQTSGARGPRGLKGETEAVAGATGALVAEDGATTGEGGAGTGVVTVTAAVVTAGTVEVDDLFNRATAM